MPTSPRPEGAPTVRGEAVRGRAAEGEEVAPGEAAGGARAGYLGPEGTFSEEALLASGAPGALEPVPLATIYDTITAVRDGEVEWAIVPIENSLDGSITVTLDALAEEAEDLGIVGETLLPVRHALIAAQAVALGEIEEVASHPQVFGQCTRFLREQLPRARLVPASSTAVAVRELSAGGGARAGARRGAIGTALAARIYRAHVIAENVQDRDDNETRFIWLSRRARGRAREAPLREEARVGRRWKTSLVFWGPGADRAGWLVRCLDEFARREINLTKIESRPRRERMGHYMFFVDLEGGEQEAAVAEALAGLRARCEAVRVLGSYRAAAPPGGG